MHCPYCAEDIKDEASVCKHCHRDLFVIKPLLAKISELTAREASLERTVKRDEEELSHIRYMPMAKQAWGLSGLEVIALGYISHVVLQFWVVFLDLKLTYFKIASLALPMIFGMLWRQVAGRTLLAGFLLGVIIAATALPTELKLVAVFEKSQFLPKDAYEWWELGFHTVSISFGVLSGVIFRQLVMAIYVPSAKANPIIEWMARFIVEQFGEGKPRFTLRAVRSMVNSILGFISACVSILAGMWEYLLK